MASVQAAHATVLRQTREPQRAQSCSLGAGSKAGIDSRAPKAPPGPAVSGLVRLLLGRLNQRPLRIAFCRPTLSVKLSSIVSRAWMRSRAAAQLLVARAEQGADVGLLGAQQPFSQLSDGKTSYGLESAMLSLCL